LPIFHASSRQQSSHIWCRKKEIQFAPVLSVDIVVCLAVEEVYLPQLMWLISPEMGQSLAATEFLQYELYLINFSSSVDGYF